MKPVHSLCTLINLMISLFKRIDNKIVRLARQEKDPINQVRAQIMVYMMCAYVLYLGFLVVVYFFDREYLDLLRVSIFFTISTALLVSVLLVKGSWKPVSHVAIGIITFAVWSNILLYVQGVNTAALQYVWIATVLSFYMHGLKWGWFYSVVNVLPVMIYTFVEYTEYNYLINDLRLLYKAEPATPSVYLFVLLGNFLILIYLNYFFFKSFIF